MSWKQIFSSPPVRSIKNNLDVWLVFLVSLGFLVPLTINLCHQPLGNGFDAQNIYLWEYLPSMGIIPLKENFYLYGYLAYYKTTSVFVFLTYALISPLFYTLTYATYLKRLFPSKTLAIIALVCLVCIVHPTLGVHTLSRYGLLLIGLLLTTAAITRSVVKPRGLVLVGFTTSLIILASTAEGIYTLTLSLLLINLHLLFTRPFKRPLLKQLFINNSAYLLGLIIGLIPLVVLNTLLDNWAGFLETLRHHAYVAIYAKSDFIPQDRLQAVLLAGLWLAVLVLSLDLFKPKLRVKPAYWLILALTLATLAVQQKNLVRSSTYATLAYTFVLLIGLYGYSLKRMVNRLAIYLAPVILIILTFILMDIAHLALPAKQLRSKIITWYRQPPPINSQLCSLSQADPAQLEGSERFTPLVQYLSALYPGKSVFPFPYDPVLYIYLKQLPAPYPNYYNASPLTAQIANLNFMDSQPVGIVVYDLYSLIFDAAPEFVRNQTFFNYLLDHFVPVKQIDDFIILERVATPSSWFTSNQVKTYPKLITRLTDFDWGQVPRLEGIKHASNLSLSADLLTADMIATASDPLLLVNYPPELTTAGTLSASNSGQLITSLHFTIRNGGDYLFHLKNIPQLHYPFDQLDLSLTPEPKTLEFYNNSIEDLW